MPFVRLVRAALAAYRTRLSIGPAHPRILMSSSRNPPPLQARLPGRTPKQPEARHTHAASGLCVTTPRAPRVFGTSSRPSLYFRCSKNNLAPDANVIRKTSRWTVYPAPHRMQGLAKISGHVGNLHQRTRSTRQSCSHYHEQYPWRGNRRIDGMRLFPRRDGQTTTRGVRVDPRSSYSQVSLVKASIALAGDVMNVVALIVLDLRASIKRCEPTYRGSRRGDKTGTTGHARRCKLMKK